MKLSEILYTRVADLWEEAARKPFVMEMAKGTLDIERFRYYMIQDYLYLIDYIDILNSTLDHTGDPDLRSFLENVIEETRKETDRVHIPNMKAIGIEDTDIINSTKADVIIEYQDYMRRQLEDLGLMAGLTALLQCSWVYAYIGHQVSRRYPEAIASSPYRSWFDAYTCREYLDNNQQWIDILDRESQGISPDQMEKLCDIFRECAIFENRLWDHL